MQLYLTISRGRRADLSTPIVALSDQRLIRLLLSQFALIAEDDLSCEPEGECNKYATHEDGRRMNDA